jgi:hypothetical protein
LSIGRIEPVFEVLLDYNPVSHCGSRVNRDAALVRLVAMLVTLFRAVSIVLQAFHE